MLDRSLIERAGRLKVIGRAGVGVDNVDVDAATRRGIVVANAPEATVVSAAEHAGAAARGRPERPPGARRAQGGPVGMAASRGSSWLERRSASSASGESGVRSRDARWASGCASSPTTRTSPSSGSAELGVEPAPTPEDVYREADLVTVHLLTTRRGGSSTARRSQRWATAQPGRQRRPRRAGRSRRRSRTRSGRARSRGRAARRVRGGALLGPAVELEQVVVTPHLAGSTGEAQDRAGLIIAEQVAAGARRGAGRDGGEHPGRRAWTWRSSARTSRWPGSRAARDRARVRAAAPDRRRAHGLLSEYDTRP